MITPNRIAKHSTRNNAMRLLNSMILIDPQEHEIITDEDGAEIGAVPPLPPETMCYGTVLDYSPYVSSHVSIGDYIMFFMTTEPFYCPTDRKMRMVVQQSDVIAILDKPAITKIPGENLETC